MAFADLQNRVNTTALNRLGEDIVLDGITVRADFSEPFATGYMEGVSAEARDPQVTLLTSDVPAPVHGKTVTARGKAFQVVSHRPDGFGLSTLMLELA